MKNNIKKELKIERNDSWVYTLLLSALSILISSIREYTFTIYNINVSYSVLLIAIIYLIINNITKKFKYNKSIISLFASVIILFSYLVILSFAFGKNVNPFKIANECIPLLISGLINIAIYEYLSVNTKKPFILIFLAYLFSVVIYMLIYTIIGFNVMIIENYWETYLLTIIINFILVIPITYVDKKIKRGI